jgi:hypothetical protein
MCYRYLVLNEEDSELHAVVFFLKVSTWCEDWTVPIYMVARV